MSMSDFEKIHGSGCFALDEVRKSFAKDFLNSQMQRLADDFAELPQIATYYPDPRLTNGTTTVHPA